MDAPPQPKMIHASVHLQKMSGHTLRWFCQSLLWWSICSFFLSQKAYLPLRMRKPFIVSEALPLFNGGKIFWLVMMALRRWQSHHRSTGGCQKSWEMTCRRPHSFALQAAECRLWQAVWSDWARILRPRLHRLGQHIRTKESIVWVEDLRVSCAPLRGPG